jgi:hypothetical protein
MVLLAGSGVLLSFISVISVSSCSIISFVGRFTLSMSGSTSSAYLLSVVRLNSRFA